MKKESKTTVEVSTATTLLIESLRQIEEARETYYNALIAKHGEDNAEEVFNTTCGEWDRVYNLVQEEFNLSVRETINRTDLNTTNKITI